MYQRKLKRVPENGTVGKLGKPQGNEEEECKEMGKRGSFFPPISQFPSRPTWQGLEAALFLFQSIFLMAKIRLVARMSQWEFQTLRAHLNFSRGDFLGNYFFAPCAL